MTNELTSGTNLQQLLPIEPSVEVVVKKRGRGRPKGSKNKPKLFAPQQQEGWDIEYEKGSAKISKPKSSRVYKKWQREWIKPQFSLSRKEAYEVFFSFLRSASGKVALKDIIVQGSVGIGKMSDTALAKYLEQTNLLSKYPHEVVIKGE